MMCFKNYSEEEVRSLKFYQGDKNIYDVKENLEEFYKTPKAYMTLNALMYDGIDNEEIRIMQEGHQLSPQLFYNIDEILKVYENIFSIMNKSLCQRKEQEVSRMFTYRMERLQAFELLKKGHTISFTSTSKKENMGIDYFRRKDGLLILQFQVPSDMPYIDMNEVLGDKNTFFEQHEVLLPPFVKMSMRPRKLTPEEEKYRDINNHPPIGKYEVTFQNHFLNRVSNCKDEHILRTYLMDESNIYNAFEVIDNMNKRRSVNDFQKEIYVKWKKYFQELVREIFWRMFEKTNDAF